MVDRTMGAMLRSLRARVTSLERRLARSIRAINPASLAAVGDVKITARSAAPAGWLICAGQSLLRTDYPALFDAIGTTYGSTDALRFNLPDTRGRVAAGRDTAQTEFNAMGEKGGAKTQALTEAQLPAHTHTQNFASNAVAAAGGTAVGGMTGSSGAAPILAQQVTSSVGGNEAHNNLQPYIVFNYIIKV